MIFRRFSGLRNAKNFDKFILLFDHYFLPVHNIYSPPIQVGCACAIYAINSAMSRCCGAGNRINTSRAQTEILRSAELGGEFVRMQMIVADIDIILALGLNAV